MNNNLLSSEYRFDDKKTDDSITIFQTEKILSTDFSERDFVFAGSKLDSSELISSEKIEISGHKITIKHVRASKKVPIEIYGSPYVYYDLYNIGFVFSDSFFLISSEGKEEESEIRKEGLLLVAELLINKLKID